MPDEDKRTRVERQQDAVLEYFKQAHDTQEHLATLSAGAIVLIGTFLKDIFPITPNGVLEVGLPTKLLIVVSFVSFGVSLATSVYLTRRYTYRYLYTAQLDEEEFERRFLRSNSKEPPPRSNSEELSRSYVDVTTRPISLFSFPLGLAAFGLAVLVTLL